MDETTTGAVFVIALGLLLWRWAEHSRRSDAASKGWRRRKGWPW